MASFSSASSPIPSVPREPALVTSLANLVPASVASEVASEEDDAFLDATLNRANFVDVPLVVNELCFDTVETLLERSPDWPRSTASERMSLFQEPSRVFSELSQRFGDQRLPERTAATARSLDQLARFSVSLAWFTRFLLERLSEATDGWSSERARASVSTPPADVGDLKRRLKAATDKSEEMQQQLDVLLAAHEDDELKLASAKEREETLEARVTLLEAENRRRLGDPATVANFLRAHVPTASLCDQAALNAALEACRIADPAPLSSIALMASFLRPSPASASYSSPPGPAPLAPPASGPTPAPPSTPASSGDTSSAITTTPPTSAPSVRTTSPTISPALGSLAVPPAAVGTISPALGSLAVPPAAVGTMTSETPASALATLAEASSTTPALASRSDDDEDPPDARGSHRGATEEEEKGELPGDDFDFGGPDADLGFGSSDDDSFAGASSDAPMGASETDASSPDARARRPPAAVPSPKRVRREPFVFLRVPQPVDPAVILIDVTATLYADMTLAELYDALRQDRAYDLTLPRAARTKLRSPELYRVRAVPTDLVFPGGATMGAGWKLGPGGKQRDKMNGWDLQVEGTTGNTHGYPNYGVQHTQSKLAVEAYGRYGVEHYLALLRTRPWDELWANRVTRTYLMDMRLLSGDGVSWALKTLRFAYAYRQALWERYFWLHCQKSTNLSLASWIPVAARRERLERHLTASWEQLLREMPADFKPFLPLWEAEPAFWFCPSMHCNWVPPKNLLPDAPPVEGAEPLLAQPLRELAAEEPARVQWVDPYTESFVASVNQRAQRTLALHHSIGISWTLPPPWNEPSYVPWSLDARSGGTPGPDFLEEAFDQATFDSWVALVASFKMAANLYGGHPSSRPDRDETPSPLDSQLRAWIPGEDV